MQSPVLFQKYFQIFLPEFSNILPFFNIYLPFLWKKSDSCPYFLEFALICSVHAHLSMHLKLILGALLLHNLNITTAQLIFG